MQRCRLLAIASAALFFVGCSKVRPVEPPPSEAVPTEAAADTSAARAAGRPAARIDPTSVDVLRQAIDSKDYATRLIAIEAIGETRAEMFLPWLERCLGDPEHDVRMATVAALQGFRSPRSVALLVSVRDDTSEGLDIRALAASALLISTP